MKQSWYDFDELLKSFFKSSFCLVSYCMSVSNFHLIYLEFNGKAGKDKAAAAARPSTSISSTLQNHLNIQQQRLKAKPS